MARAILACGLLLVLLGLTACSGSTYLIKPGTADPVHVVRCQTELTAKSAVSAVIFLPLGFIAQWQDYQDCLEQRHNEGYVDAPKEPECAYWRDDKPREPIKIRDRCKDNPPQWVLRGGNVTPHAAVAPTAPPRSSPSTVVGTWSGTLHGQQGSYPFTMTFRDDGTYQATSATLKPGSFEGTWQVSNGNVVWKSITTGRTGMATVQEANGKRTLRIIPDDGAYMLEMTPTTEVADVPTDFRKWLRGNWAGSGGG